MQAVMEFFQSPIGLAVLSALGIISAAIGNSPRFGGEKWVWLRKLAGLMGKKSS